MENLVETNDIFIMIFSFLLFIFLFSFLNWNTIKKYKFGRVVSFDLAILTFFLWVGVGRIIYIIENLDAFKSYSWHYLPIRNTLAGIKIFDTLPWAFLALWENIEFTFIFPIALICAILFLNLYIVKIKAIKKFFFKDVFITFIYSYIPVLLVFGFFDIFSAPKVNLNIVGILNQPAFSIYILEAIILSSTLILFKFLESKFKKSYLFRYFFPTIFVIYIIILRAVFFAENILIWKLDIVQITAILTYLIYLLKSNNNFDQINLDSQKQKINYKFGLNRDYSKLVQQDIQQNNNYMSSFADYKVNAVKMTFKERLRQFINKMKRL